MKKIFFFLATITLACSCSAQDQCRLWKPASFCDIPDTLVTFTLIHGENVTWHTLSCTEFDKKKNEMTGVWITIRNSKDTAFSISTRYRNIRLLRKSDGKVIRPYAILWDDWNPSKNISENVFMTRKFRARKYNVFFNHKKKFDLIIIFKDANPGDTVVIDDFIKVAVTD
jgi:hypothetical protein